MKESDRASTLAAATAMAGLENKDKLALSGLCLTMTEEILASQLGLRTFEQIKINVMASVYWAQFVQLVDAGKVHSDFLGAAGRCMIAWAREGKP